MLGITYERERLATSPYRITLLPILLAVTLILLGIIFDFLLGWDTAGGIAIALSVFFVLFAVLSVLLIVFLNTVDE